jgi:hypothetical protein
LFLPLPVFACHSERSEVEWGRTPALAFAFVFAFALAFAFAFVFAFAFAVASLCRHPERSEGPEELNSPRP